MDWITLVRITKNNARLLLTGRIWASNDTEPHGCVLFPGPSACITPISHAYDFGMKND